MNDRHWTRLQELFLRALELDEEERAALLAGVEGSVRREVEAMLAAHDDPDEAASRLAGAEPSRAIPEGLRLGRYRVGGVLGRGGMGVVHEAQDVQLGRAVALKFLPRSSNLDETAKRRFLREARAASALNHSSIVTIYEVGSEGDLDFIAMELVEGESLAERLARGPLGKRRVLRYASTIARALAAAHEARLVHRDLKPGNVMVTPNDEVKILDFGLAKRFAPDDSGPWNRKPPDDPSIETASGLVLGTPSYLSPEQAAGRPSDPRSDLFALGCILFEMLTGEKPFRGDGALEVLSAILRDDPPPPSSVRSSIDPAWDPIVRRLLAKDPDARYQSAEALLDDLDRLEVGSGDAPRRQPSRPWRWAALVGALVAVVAGGFWATEITVVPEEQTGGDSFPQFTHRLLSDLPGWQMQPSLSPDGQRVAFVREDAAGVPQVWITDLTGEDLVQVTEGERPATAPSWFPGGDRIVFARRGEGIWEVSPVDGEPRQLLQVGSHPALSPDGDRLAFTRVSHGFGDYLEEGDERRIWVADGDGSDPRPLSAFEPTHFGFFARCDFSPDGDELVVFWPQPNRPLGDLWIVPISGGEPRKITDLGFLSWGTAPVWSPDGRWILFSSDHTGSSTLWRVSVDGRTLEPVTAGSGSDLGADLSSDMRHLVYATGRRTADVRIYAPDGESSRVGHERRDLLIKPRLSPDGDRVAFFSRTADAFDLFVADLETGEARQVTRGAGWVNANPVWSGDGETLYYYRQGIQNPEASTYRRIGVDGRSDEELLDGWRWTVQHQTNPSPDETRLVYLVRSRGRNLETRVRRLATGAEHTLPKALYDPQWTPDGERIYGADWGDGRIYFCAADGSGCRSVTRGWSSRLAPDGTILFVLRGRPPTVWSVDLEPGPWPEPVPGSETELFTVESSNRPDFGWGVRPGGEVVVHGLRADDAELWIGEAQTR